MEYDKTLYSIIVISTTKELVCWVWFYWVMFYGISTLLGYAMSNPIYIYIYIFTYLIFTSIQGTRKKTRQEQEIKISRITAQGKKKKL